MEGSQSATARQAGLGVLWLTAAKFYFMGTGLLLLLVLPALFKRFAGAEHVALYGDYRTVAGITNWFNMVFIGGTIQAVAKFVSERESRGLSVKWQTLRIQLVLGGAASLCLLLPADVIAQHFYKDPSLAPYLRIASPVVLLYACYAVIIGCMNGLKRFRHQATMDMMFATLKVGLTIGLVAAGMAIVGAVVAFVATAAVMLVVSWLVLGKLDPGEKVRWQDILGFEWQTLLIAFFLNGLLQVDVQLLKALAPPELGPASDQTGIYAAAQQIGQIPYVAVLSVAFVVFPLVSQSVFAGDHARTRDYVSTTNRFVWVALTGIVLPFALEPEGILGLVYPSEYASGASFFAIQCVAYLFLACMVVNATIVTGSGRPWLSASVFAGALGLAAFLCTVLVPLHGALGAAMAMAVAMLAGLAALALVCLRIFRTFVPVLTLVRSLTAAGLVVAVNELALPETAGKLATVVRCALLMAAYAGLLVASGEIPLRAIRARLGGRRG